MKTYLDDREMSKAIRRGGYEAFECLFKTYSPRMRSIAMRFISDKSLVDDIVQLCFLNLWEKRTKMPVVESLDTFLFTVVRNRCLNELRRVNKEQDKTVSMSDVVEDNLSVNSENHPECDLLYNELSGKIDEVMGDLPPRTREIFMLSRFYGLKNREIAAEEHISIKVVERHIQKALKVFNSHFSRPAM